MSSEQQGGRKTSLLDRREAIKMLAYISFVILVGSVGMIADFLAE